MDPIVRIQAGRLRRSLERYYLMSGAEDPVRIELPRGTYVPVARWAAESAQRPREGGRGHGAAAADGWPSVVVRLFEIDGWPELEPALSRLNEQLCVEMGHYGDVRVVRRRELDQLGSSRRAAATSSCSGRVSCDEGAARITARLLDSRNASQVWAEDYRGPVNATSAFYVETGRAIAARVASEHGVVAKQLWSELRDRPIDELPPYGAILRSYQFFFNRDAADYDPARQALERVVRQRPECVLAWAQLARLSIANYSFEIVRRADPDRRGDRPGAEGRAPRPVLPAGPRRARERVPDQGRARRRPRRGGEGPRHQPRVIRLPRMDRLAAGVAWATGSVARP